MICQDCNKKEAEFIIYDLIKNTSFLVCKDCVKDNDLVMSHTIKDIVDLYNK